MADSTPLDAEIAKIEAELQPDPRWQRWWQLRRLRREYLALPSIEPKPTAVPVAPASIAGVPQGNGHDPSRPPGRQRSPERQRAIDETAKFLAGRTIPTKLTDIDAHLTNIGVRLGGTDPVNNLSALLSTSNRFQAHGKSGWTVMPTNENRGIIAPVPIQPSVAAAMTAARKVGGT